MTSGPESKLLKPDLERLGNFLKVPAERIPSALKYSGIAYDSRKVQRGDVFFCVPGQKTNGNEFIEQAIQAGASCIVSEQQHAGLTVPAIVVSDVRQVLADLANAFYDFPSRKLRLLGVTGTNGKTTTTHLIEQILERANKKVGLIGTLGARWDEGGERKYVDIKHTTPQATDLQRLLADMVDRKLSHVAMEVSSHALALKRVASCDFAVACLTNITQDHLDFHHTMEHYWRSKRLLFEQLNASAQPNKLAVINADDRLSPEFIKVMDKDVRTWTYSFSPGTDCFVIDVNFDFRGTRLRLHTPHGQVQLSLKLNGRFNVYNTMAALLIALNEGIPPDVCKQALEEFAGVPGRFEVVSSPNEDGGDPLCIVDYAHTPDGLENVLRAGRALVPPNGQLIAVFGCGGDRDSSKRPQMGAIAENLADKLVVTSDNPRTEEPDQIIADILAGIRRIKGVVVEPDRAAAIAMAISEATERDVIVVAGKGHETYQILKDKTIDFDDREQVREALVARHTQTAL